MKTLRILGIVSAFALVLTFSPTKPPKSFDVPSDLKDAPKDPSLESGAAEVEGLIRKARRESRDAAKQDSILRSEAAGGEPGRAFQCVADRSFREFRQIFFVNSTPSSTVTDIGPETIARENWFFDAVWRRNACRLGGGDGWREISARLVTGREGASGKLEDQIALTDVTDLPAETPYGRVLPSDWNSEAPFRLLEASGRRYALTQEKKGSRTFLVLRRASGSAAGSGDACRWDLDDLRAQRRKDADGAPLIFEGGSRGAPQFTDRFCWQMMKAGSSDVDELFCPQGRILPPPKVRN